MPYVARKMISRFLLLLMFLNHSSPFVPKHLVLGHLLQIGKLVDKNRKMSCFSSSTDYLLCDLE